MAWRSTCATVIALMALQRTASLEYDGDEAGSSAQYYCRLKNSGKNFRRARCTEVCNFPQVLEVRCCQRRGDKACHENHVTASSDCAHMPQPACRTEEVSFSTTMATSVALQNPDGAESTTLSSSPGPEASSSSSITSAMELTTSTTTTQRTTTTSMLPRGLDLTTPLKINCGGADAQSESGGSWVGDEPYLHRDTKTACDWEVPVDKNKAYTDLPDVVLACHRLPVKGVSSLEYVIPVNQLGDYDVTLFFAERVPVKQERRQFDIYINDALMFQQYDILKQAGRYYRAVAYVIPVSVSSANLSIRLSQTSGKRPIISAISIKRKSLPATRMPQPTEALTEAVQDAVERVDPTGQPAMPGDEGQMINEAAAPQSTSSLKDNIPFIVGVAGAGLIIAIVAIILIAKAKNRLSKRRRLVVQAGQVLAENDAGQFSPFSCANPLRHRMDSVAPMILSRSRQGSNQVHIMTKGNSATPEEPDNFVTVDMRPNPTYCLAADGRRSWVQPRTGETYYFAHLSRSNEVGCQPSEDEHGYAVVAEYPEDDIVMESRPLRSLRRQSTKWYPASEVSYDHLAPMLARSYDHLGPRTKPGTVEPVIPTSDSKDHRLSSLSTFSADLYSAFSLAAGHSQSNTTTSVPVPVRSGVQDTERCPTVRRANGSSPVPPPPDYDEEGGGEEEYGQPMLSDTGYACPRPPAAPLYKEPSATLFSGDDSLPASLPSSTQVSRRASAIAAGDNDGITALMFRPALFNRATSGA